MSLKNTKGKLERPEETYRRAINILGVVAETLSLFPAPFPEEYIFFFSEAHKKMRSNSLIESFFVENDTAESNVI